MTLLMLNSVKLRPLQKLFPMFLDQMQKKADEVILEKVKRSAYRNMLLACYFTGFEDVTSFLYGFLSQLLRKWFKVVDCG
jgi:hypothetical protein